MDHMMALVNHGPEIFQDDRDRQRFDKNLGEACKTTGWRVQTGVLPTSSFICRWGGRAATGSAV